MEDSGDKAVTKEIELHKNDGDQYFICPNCGNTSLEYLKPVEPLEGFICGNCKTELRLGFSTGTHGVLVFWEEKSWGSIK